MPEKLTKEEWEMVQKYRKSTEMPIKQPEQTADELEIETNLAPLQTEKPKEKKGKTTAISEDEDNYKCPCGYSAPVQFELCPKCNQHLIW